MPLPFDPEDPFPLPLADAHSYADAQEHARLCDAWLGLETGAIENELAERVFRATAARSEQRLWIGLPVRSLLTPYSEIREMLERLRPRPGQVMVDFGAGYGRIAFVLGRHFPGVRFIGYEIVPERAMEAARRLRSASCSDAEMRVVDLAAAEFVPEDADFYFIYDFGSRDAIEKSLLDLRRIAARRAITVIGRGRAARDAIERGHPWLSQVAAPAHFAHYSIYRSA